jgi:curved DNA-binding protein CbpA
MPKSDVNSRTEALALLSLSPGFTQEELRAAWKRKISEWHPDKLDGMADELKRLATERMQKLNAAYDFLRSNSGGADRTQNTKETSKSARQETAANSYSKVNEQRVPKENSSGGPSPSPDFNKVPSGTLNAARFRSNSLVFLLFATIFASIVLAVNSNKNGSSPRSDQAGAVSREADSQCSAVMIKTLKNKSYGLGNDSLTLQNGALAPAPANSENGHVESGLEGSACGDLDGDGKEDAIAVLYDNGGGSGTFVSLVALLSKSNRRSRDDPSFELGDRVVVKTIAITNRIVTVTYLGHGPDDGLCCPSVTKTIKVRLKNNALVCADEACKNSKSNLGG